MYDGSGVSTSKFNSLTATNAAGTRPGAATNHAERLVDEVRQAIAAERWVLGETRKRRDLVLAAARQFMGALDTFPSGSLAHGTVNNPVSDGDGGVILDRRAWATLGPDGSGDGPDGVMRQLAAFVVVRLSDEYPALTVTLTKRAILFEFHAPMDDEDPSIDLIVCLTRRDAPGFWIPNREKAGWDPSNPQKHTQLMTAKPKDIRVFRARVIRLAKAAINNDDVPVVCPWNISALALRHLTEISSMTEGVAHLLHRMAFEIAQGDTPDPAGVSAPINLPDGVARAAAIERLSFFAGKVDEALHHRFDSERVLEALAQVWPEQLEAQAKSLMDKHRLADAFRTVGVTSPVVTEEFRRPVGKAQRSYGDAS
jgi:hypothetical protein